MTGPCKIQTVFDFTVPGSAVSYRRSTGAGFVDAAALQGDDYADTPVRFDEVAMMVVKENRALLRHHINCFGEMEPLS